MWELVHGRHDVRAPFKSNLRVVQANHRSGCSGWCFESFHDLGTGVKQEHLTHTRSVCGPQGKFLQYS